MRGLVDWQSLGLVLGLLYGTLEKIRHNRQANYEECKMEMLAAWLQQQDDVSLKGLPSWLVLQAGLRRIREIELADKIVTGKLS